MKLNHDNILLQLESTVSASLFSRFGRVVLFAVAIIFPVSAHAEDIYSALGKVYQNNPELVQARTQLRAVDEQLPQAKAGYRPTITLTPEVGLRRNRNRLPTVTTENRLERRSVALALSQNLYAGGGDLAAINQAQASIFQQRAQLVTTEQTVLLDAVTAYMDVINGASIIELNTSNVNRISKALEATEIRFQVGEVTRTDVVQAEARLALAQADLVQSEGAYRSAKARYYESVGEEADELKFPTRLPELPLNLEKAIEIAMEINPAVQSAQYAIDVAKSSLNVQEANLLPSLDVTASTSYTRDSNTQGDSTDQAQLNAVLTIPLYQAGLVASQLRQAKQSLAASHHGLEDIRRTIIQQAHSAWINLESAKSVVRAQEAAVKSNEIALEGVGYEAEVGERTVLDILDAQQELVDAEVGLINARRDVVVAHYAVLSAMGHLTNQKLDLGVPVYDENTNTKKVQDKWWGTEISE